MERICKCGHHYNEHIGFCAIYGCDCEKYRKTNINGVHTNLKVGLYWADYFESFYIFNGNFLEVTNSVGKWLKSNLTISEFESKKPAYIGKYTTNKYLNGIEALRSKKLFKRIDMSDWLKEDNGKIIFAKCGSVFDLNLVDNYDSFMFCDDWITKQ